MKRRHVLIILCSLLMFGLVACKPKEVETVKDPFVLGTNSIVEININLQLNLSAKTSAPFTKDILKMDQWTKTTATIQDTETLRHIMKDDQGYLYKIYRQDGKYLAIITHHDYMTVHRYWISEDVMLDIVKYLNLNYIANQPGYMDFVTAYWGQDEATAFSIKPKDLWGLYTFRDFSTDYEMADLTRVETLFSLIDELGNVYHFYPNRESVVVQSAADQSISQYHMDISSQTGIYNKLIAAYPDERIFYHLNPGTITSMYIDGLDTYSPSKLLTIHSSFIDDINNRLNFDMVYKSSIEPNDQSRCDFIFKDNKGTFYVYCYDPYVIGIGSDPKGELTYYSLNNTVNESIADYLWEYPLPAPSGSSVADQVFTRANAAAHCDCGIGVDLSLSQSNVLNGLMDLGNHAFVRLDYRFPEENFPQDLFILEGPDHRYWRFYIDDKSQDIFFEIKYTKSNYGTTYYWIDDAGYDRILEAHFMIAGMIDTAKADANPTFDAFYIGDQFATATALNELSMTTLTSAQITKVDGLLQRTKWQEISLFDEAIRLNSSFILRKNSTTYYIFSQVRSMTVVTEKVIDGESSVYLVPSGALSNTLTYLKTLK